MGVIRPVGLITGDYFREEECMAFFTRVRFGHLGVSMRGLPVVVPVLYVVDETGFLIGLSPDDVANAMTRNVIALQADGWDDDTARRWTTLAVGIPTRAIIQDVDPLRTKIERPAPWDEPHVFRLRPHVLSGRWIT